MARGKHKRSKTTTMVQFAIAQSHSPYYLTIDMVAPSLHSAATANLQQILVAVPLPSTTAKAALQPHDLASLRGFIAKAIAPPDCPEP